MPFACALALTSAGPAFAQERPALKRHEVALSGLAGYALTGYDYYDSTIDDVTAWGLGGEYAYRVTQHLRVGVEGSRIVLTRLRLDDHYGGVWTATPFVGLTWGSGLIQGGVRAGFGLAYGGRRPVNGVPDREGPGYDAQLLGELAICGSSVDVVGRLGVRFIHTSWDAPRAHIYPTDLPLGMMFVSLGARWKL
jgi:hypothetical protein